jgi:hypothetical protein
MQAFLSIIFKSSLHSPQRLVRLLLIHLAVQLVHPQLLDAADAAEMAIGADLILHAADRQVKAAAMDQVHNVRNALLDVF